MSLKSQVGLRYCFENSQICSHLPRVYVWEALLKEENLTLKKVSISLCENRIKHKSVSSLPSPDASLFNYASQWPCAFTFLIQSCCPLRGIADASLCGDLKIVTRGRKEGNTLKVAIRVPSCLTSVFPVFPTLPSHIIPRPLVLTESLLILQPLDYSNNSSGMVHRREV